MVKRSRRLLGVFEFSFVHEEVGSTMKRPIALGASLAIVLLSSSLMAGEGLKSGPQAGDSIPGPFHPMNVTGDNAGSKFCLV